MTLSVNLTMHNITQRNLDYILSFLVALSMATNYIVQKSVVLVFPPYLMLSLETIIVAITMYPLNKKMPLPFKKMLLLSFIWGPLTYCSLLAAARLNLDVSVMLVAGKTNTLFAAIGAAIFLKEKLEKKTVIGIMIAFIGLIVLSRAPNVLEKPLAFALVIVFAISWALYNIIIKVYKPKNLNSLLTWVCILSSPQTLLISLITENYQTLNMVSFKSCIGLLYLGLVGIFLTMITWYKLLIRNKVSNIVPFLLLTPVIGSTLAFFIYREPITITLLIASTLIISGVAISVLKK